MNSKSDPSEEPKDRTKLIWLGVAGVIVLLVAALVMLAPRKGDVTEVRAKHILVKCNAGDPVDRARALELITDLRRRIENGESFAKLAKEFSDDEFSAARGGDLGYASKGLYEAAFEQYVWSAPIGQMSDILQTKYGFHLVVVLDRHVSKTDQYEMELERKAVENPAPPAATPAPNL
jgi:parvulin-like peptidyl-prolyl isomerase